ITPVWTHFELAKAALESGKHVFVEKPFTSNVGQAEQLINLAEQKNLKIMVDYTFLFTGAVKKIKQLLQEGSLGKLYYYDSTRVKVRKNLVGGGKKMLVWNDLEADEKIKVYDKGVDIGSREGVYELLVNYRSGDMWAPQLEQVEALRQELTYFMDCISNDRTPMNGGPAGLRVVKMLEAAN